MYITADNSIKLIADLCIPIKLHYISLYNQKIEFMLTLRRQAGCIFVHVTASSSSTFRRHERINVHVTHNDRIIVHVSASRTHQRSRHAKRPHHRSRLGVTTASTSGSLFSIRRLHPYTHRLSLFVFYCNELRSSSC